MFQKLRHFFYPCFNFSVFFLFTVRPIIFDGMQFMTMEDLVYLLSMREQYQASLEYKIPDVPTDAELQNLPKDSRTFDCMICLDTVPMNTVYTFNCDHQLCCPCARNLTSRKCPFCRADISSSAMSKRKIEETEAKFAQLEKDEEFARNLQAKFNGEEYFDSDAETVRIAPSDDDDVVIMETKKSEITTQVTTKTIIHKKGNLKVDKEAKMKPAKKAKIYEDSDEEWKPKFKRGATKKNEDAQKKSELSDDDEFIDF